VGDGLRGMRLEVAAPGGTETGAQRVVPAGGMLLGGMVLGLLGMLGLLVGLLLGMFGLLVGVLGLLGLLPGAALATIAAAPIIRPESVIHRRFMGSSLIAGEPAP
jgi:hypothetical protein